MKIQNLLLLLCLVFIVHSAGAQNEKPIVLKSVKLASESQEILKGVQIRDLKMDREGSWTVSKDFTILLYEKSGRLVFQRKGDKIIGYDGKKDFGGIIVHCGGCSNGCQPYKTPRGKITYYGCTQCSEQSKYQAGCLSAVEIPTKDIVDRESAL